MGLPPRQRMAVGYVLINVKPGSELNVYETVKELDMVEDATLLFFIMLIAMFKMCFPQGILGVSHVAKPHQGIVIIVRVLVGVRDFSRK